MKKRISSFLLALLLLLSLTACGKTVETVPEQQVLTLKDQAGREVVLNETPSRIVSGYYISTSALIALGMKDTLVAVEAKAESRPIYSLAAPELIDLPNVGSAKAFDLEGCIAQNPDLVILPKKLKDQADALSELGIPVLLVNPENGESLREMITLLSDATNTVERGKALIERMDALEAALIEKLEGTESVNVYMAGNSSVLTTAGGNMYQSTLVDTAGGSNVAAALEDSYWAEVSYEQLLDWNPDVIVLPAEAGYDVGSVLEDPALSLCSAVQTQSVYAMPNNVEAWDSPVPGSVLGEYYLASVLHPERVSEADFISLVGEFYSEFYGFNYEK